MSLTITTPPLEEGVFCANTTTSIKTLQPQKEAELPLPSSFSKVTIAPTLTTPSTLPELDAPLFATDTTAALEQLLAHLLLENEEQQMTLSKERIESHQAELHVRHELQMAKLAESIQEAAKAETSNLLTRVFSWVFTALSVVTAVAACVATGGVAVPAVAGAVIAVGMLTLSESGATEAIGEALSKSIQETFDCPKSKAELGAQIVLAGVMLTLAIGSMVGGGIAGASSLATRAFTVGNQTAKTIQSAATIANGVISTATTATQGHTTVKRYESSMAQVEATEIEQFTLFLQRALEEEEAELQRLLDAYQSTLSALAGMIEQDTQTQHAILSRIDTMA